MGPGNKKLRETRQRFLIWYRWIAVAEKKWHRLGNEGGEQSCVSDNILWDASISKGWLLFYPHPFRALYFALLFLPPFFIHSLEERTSERCLQFAHLAIANHPQQASMTSKTHSWNSAIKWKMPKMHRMRARRNTRCFGPFSRLAISVSPPLCSRTAFGYRCFSSTKLILLPWIIGSRYIYDLYYEKEAISKQLYDWLLKNGYADPNLIAKWKKQGYEKVWTF